MRKSSVTVACLLLTLFLHAEDNTNDIKSIELQTDRSRITAHLDQAEIEIDAARSDAGKDLTSSAWLRVVYAGSELDGGLLLLRGLPQKIAVWEPWGWQTETRKRELRDQQMALSKPLHDRHTRLNQIFLKLEEDVSRLMGADFNYIRTAIRALKDLCEQTNDPRWCDLATQVDQLFRSGQFDKAIQAIVGAMPDMPASQLQAEDWAVIQAGPKQPEGTGAGKTGTPASPDAKAAKAYLDELKGLYERTGDKELESLYNELKKQYDAGNYSGIIAEKQRRESMVPGGSGVSGGDSMASKLPSLGPGNTYEVNGEVFYFPNGFDQPGYLAGYIGGRGTQLKDERKMMMKFQPGEGSLPPQAFPEELERRDWDFNIEMKGEPTQKGSRGIQELVLVDRNGKTSFSVEKWEVADASGKVLLNDTKAILELPYEELPSEIIITAHGKSEWNSPFRISVTLTL